MDPLFFLSTNLDVQNCLKRLLADPALIEPHPANYLPGRLLRIRFQ